MRLNKNRVATSRFVEDHCKYVLITVPGGVEGVQEIGFLSSVPNAAVGSHYQEPQRPIYVIHIPHHYSVLYAAHDDTPPRDGEFYHFGGLDQLTYTCYKVRVFSNSNGEHSKEAVEFFILYYICLYGNHSTQRRFVLRAQKKEGENTEAESDPVKSIIKKRWELSVDGATI